MIIIHQIINDIEDKLNRNNKMNPWFYPKNPNLEKNLIRYLIFNLYTNCNFYIYKFKDQNSLEL